MRKEFGDFQTPEPLTRLILDTLVSTARTWERILEPTCGLGNFITGIAAHPQISPQAHFIGVEIQASHLAKATERMAHKRLAQRVELIHANIFDLNLAHDLTWRTQGDLLIIGNPPWVTNAELTVLHSNNAPRKSNFKGLPGFEAITGSANFDIAEFILLKLIRELEHEQPTIAMLCKTSVARNVLQFIAAHKIPVFDVWIRKIEAQTWFQASVDACLLYVSLGGTNLLQNVPVYADLLVQTPQTMMGFSQGILIADQDKYQHNAIIEGVSELTWRQGVKHDAASVMELECTPQNILHNKLGETVCVEAEYVYPLIKSTALFHRRTTQIDRRVIIPQRNIGKDTSNLVEQAPKLWAYLQAHRSAFDARKSSIYRNRAEFSIFGIGDYSFAPYKVAISGLHKTPHFSPVGQFDGRPVMFDDTCYFLPCHSPRQAALLSSLLNHPLCQLFLASVMFKDAKRPITKKLLQRIDLKQLLALVDSSTFRREVETLENEISPLPSYNSIFSEDLDLYLQAN